MWEEYTRTYIYVHRGNHDMVAMTEAAEAPTTIEDVDKFAHRNYAEFVKCIRPIELVELLLSVNLSAFMICVRILEYKHRVMANSRALLKLAVTNRAER